MKGMLIEGEDERVSECIIYTSVYMYMYMYGKMCLFGCVDICVNTDEHYFTISQVMNMPVYTSPQLFSNYETIFFQRALLRIRWFT